MKRAAITAFVSALVVGCQVDSPTRGPMADIQDANNLGGNAFFFWLPPVVQQQPPSTQVFSGALRPVVTIRALCGTGDTVRTFSGADVKVSGAHYLANWPTAEDNLDPACIYRISVKVGSSPDLGFADVNVVASGRELRDVNTNQFIPLLDDRTLPIRFFIGVGSLCRQELDAAVDCGEGTARGGEDATIVTTNGRAGTFIPAAAVDPGKEVTIIIQSVDHSDGPCIPGLVGATFEGTSTATGNSCYEFRTDPPISTVNAVGTFNGFVTVGICVDLAAVGTAREEKIQIFQFDVGEERESLIRALPNVPAPFLPCDPAFSPGLGSLSDALGNLAARGLETFLGLLAPVAASPRSLFARTNTMVFDLGAGGNTNDFSIFTWGLVTSMAKNDGDGQTAAVGAPVPIPPSVIFTDSLGAPVDSVPVFFAVTSGGGSVTGASTKSGRGGVTGVARVGSWTLGATGSNTLSASTPFGSGVIGSPETFTATGTTPADLTIHDLATSPIEPAAGPITLSAVVSNSGGTAAGPSTVSLCAMEFTLSGAGGTCEIFEGPAVPAGGSVPVSAIVTVGGPGAFTFTASVDTFEVVPESDETNNKAVGPTFGVGMITFEKYPDGSPTCGDCKVGSEFATRGVTFSFTRAAPDDTLPHICNSTPNDPAPILIPQLVNHGVTAPAIGDPCNGWLSGDMTMTFAPQADTVEFRMRGPDPGSPSAVFPVTAFDAFGAVLPAGQVVHVTMGTYTPAGPGAVGTRREERVTVTNPGGKISRVVVGESVTIKFVDNLRIVVLGP